MKGLIVEELEFWLAVGVGVVYSVANEGSKDDGWIQMVACVLCERFKLAAGRAFQPSFNESDYGNRFEYECPRCGRYKTTRSFVEKNREGLLLDKGLALSGIARAAADRGDEPLEITPDKVAALIASAAIPKRHAAYVDNLLIELATRSRYPGSSTGHMNLEQLSARVFLPADSCHQLCRQLQDRGLLKIRDDIPVSFDVMLDPRGWERVDELQRGGPGGSSVFVAMWFGDEMRDAYVRGIRPALEERGFQRPFRVDEIEHEGRVDMDGYEPKIDDRIMAEIRRARFVVADITGARQAVYYEAGFAAGLGVPVIWTGKADSFDDDKCFDTQQFAHIVWREPDDLRIKLTNLLGARGWTGRLA